MDVNDQIHAQLVKAGVRLAASLPDDWVNGLIRKVTAGNAIKQIPVRRCRAGAPIRCSKPTISLTR
jgi:sulfopyruvate decarboxylase TPP-binding subunit